MELARIVTGQGSIAIMREFKYTAMNTNEKLFDNRQLSRNQAKAISESQKDLGRVSQRDMEIALSGLLRPKNYSENMNKRLEAIERLDPLSKFIVLEFLGNSDIEQAQNSIQYAINNLQAAKDSIEE